MDPKNFPLWPKFACMQTKQNLQSVLDQRFLYIFQTLSIMTSLNYNASCSLQLHVKKSICLIYL